MRKTLLYITLGLLAVSCNKEYDTPPLEEVPATGAITIDSLRTWNQSQGSFSIQDEVSVYGVITMDENDGNIYKNVYLQDQTGALNVRMLSGGGVYQGDSVRIYLKGCYLSTYNGVLQLDSVNADYNIVKLAVDQELAPEVVSIDEITTAKESQLIKLENIQFASWEVGETYADDENLVSMDRYIEDQNGNLVIVRTSGYASFAGETIPEGSGSITCIVNHFNGEIQLLIRSFSEVKLDQPRFPGIELLKDFNDDDLYSGGWTVQYVTATIPWETSTAGGAPNPYCQISNYDFDLSQNIPCETWLISPQVDLTNAPSPVFSFDNACNYSGANLEVLVSSNYSGTGDPNAASWTPVPGVALSSGSWVWVTSGEIDFSGFGQIHVGFKYTGSASDGKTWEIDNIVIHN